MFVLFPSLLNENNFPEVDKNGKVICQKLRVLCKFIRKYLHLQLHYSLKNCSKIILQNVGIFNKCVDIFAHVIFNVQLPLPPDKR